MLTLKRSNERALQDFIQRLGKNLTQEGAEADLMVAVQPAVTAAQGNVPTGPPAIHLRDNIGAAPDRDHAAAEGWLASVAIGAFKTLPIGELFYGRFLEVGTVKQAARPWLRPAFEATRDAIISRLASLMRGRLTAVGAR